MKNKIKYLYYFRGNLSTHVQFFEAWVNAVRENGIPMELITFLKPRTYFSQVKLIRYYKSRYFHVYIDLPYSIFSKLYFFFVCCCNNKVIVHLKKRDPKQFDKLKQIFPNKIKYIVEGEGDAKSEYDYLKHHPYKSKFYDSILKGFIKEIQNQKSVFKNADYLTFGYPEMKDMLVQRYPDLKLEKKIILTPMSFKKGQLSYSSIVRKNQREKLGLNKRFVMLYAGNAFYSWQNVFRTIEIFQLVKNKLNESAFLILLIKKSDFGIVNEFLNQLNVDPFTYLMTNVGPHEMGNYLNAADLGISLRHKHIMNMTTPSGKILEYLGCGLQVITTNAMGKISRIVQDNKFGAVIENMDDDKEVLEKILPLLKHDENRRIEISMWTNYNLSIDANIGSYVELIKRVSSY